MPDLNSIHLGTELSSSQAMKLAIVEGQKGLGYVSPNPPVGCVILNSSGKLIGKGYHEYYGGPHAEVKALKGLSLDELKGAQLFVTLEPCAHQGKTPSCAKMLTQLPLSKVTYGIEDPNPLVSGKGAEMLRKAGIEVEEYKELASECEELAEIFLYNQKNKMPFVAIKVATSLDGHMGLQSGESQWITGESARIYGRTLRGQYDAVLVGAKTVIKDNPLLDLRGTPKESQQNRVIILSSSGGLATSLHEQDLYKNRDSENIFFITSEKIAKQENPNLQRIQWIATEADSKGVLNLSDALKQMYSRGIHSIFIEGGAETISHFLNTRQAQRLYVFLAPSLIGGVSGNSWSKGLFIKSLEDQVHLSAMKVLDLGGDFLISARFSYSI